jgi:transcriptional regulator with XRE-family HTH domain
MAEHSTKLRQEIAARLRLARETAGLTQAQAAKKLNLHRPSISEIEACRRRVSAEEISKLAEMYGVDVGWLTEGSKATTDKPDKLLLAARQLSQLKDRDLDRLMDLIRVLRGSGKES